MFISYVEESSAHVAAVDQLRDLLAARGADVHYAPDCRRERQCWEEWTTIQMRRADYVVVIVSEGLHRASEKLLGPGEHRGIQAEYQKLVALLTDDRPLWTRKILPVIFPGGTPDHVPLAFSGRNGTYYEEDPLTAEGARGLLTVLGLAGSKSRDQR